MHVGLNDLNKFKVIFLFIPLLILIKENCFAQEKKINFVLSAGINYSGLKYNSRAIYWKDTKFQFNNNVSIGIEYLLSENISTQILLRYSKLSYNIVYDEKSDGPYPDGIAIHSIIKHNYLFLPIHIKYYIKRQIFLLTGVETGYLVSSKSVDYIYDGSTWKWDLLNSLKKINLTVDLGVGVEKKIGKIKILYFVVYAHGITTISQKYYHSNEWRTREIYNNLGIKISL
jgi:hypothetical protein